MFGLVLKDIVNHRIDKIALLAQLDRASVF